MIRALVTGTLYEPPTRRVGKSGKAFATAKLRADSSDGSILCSLIAFGEEAEALAKQKASAAVSVAGRVTPTAWIDKNGDAKAGLSLVVEQLATLRSPLKTKETAPRVSQAAPGFNDALLEMWP